MAYEASTPQAIRNVVLVGHTGAGKTTLIEALLHATGAIARPGTFQAGTVQAGTVQTGTTVTDFDDAARRRHRSVAMAVAACEHRGVKINLIDTPGHPDFVGELRAGLRAGDAALFVVSAVDGLDGATALLWEECASLGMPRAVVVTGVDRPRADFDESVAVCQRVFGQGVVPLYLPLHDEGAGGQEVVAGLIGLLSLQLHDYSGPGRAERPADPEHRALVEPRRAELIETIIQESEDDELMDQYLAGALAGGPGEGGLGLAVLLPDLERSVARGRFFPVLPLAATSGVGVRELLDFIVAGFPAPPEREVPAVTSPDGDPRSPFRCDPHGPLVAEVVKTTTGPSPGRISLVRVFSGTLHPDQTVHVCGRTARFAGTALEHHPEHDVDEKVGMLSSPLGETLRPTGRCLAGDICAVTGLTRAETGDTVSDAGNPLLVEPWVLPEPLLPVAIRVATPSEEEKLAQALGRLTVEDFTVRVEHDPRTQQLVLWTMGEAHVALVLERLRTRYGVRVEAVPVRVSLRETFIVAASGRGRLVKQGGGHGQDTVCELDVQPLPAGSGLEFVDQMADRGVPRHVISSIEKGVRARAGRGLIGGYPLTDVRVTLTGGTADSVTSNDAALATVSGLALEDAAASAGPAGVRLLEPVDEIEVTVDDEFVGSVMTDLSARRGRVTGTEPLGTGRSTVRADVPALSLSRYAVGLRSVAHGTAVLTRRYARHEPLPPQAAQRVLAEVGDHPPTCG